MIKITLVACLLSILICSPTMAQNSNFRTPFELDNNVSATYQEAIAYYEKLAEAFPKQLQVQAHGSTDSGFPLHVAVLSKDGDFDPASIRKKGKSILFVNNAIHPGEPCGVDASMLLFKNYLQKQELQTRLENVVIVAIPFYNIGGGLNRGSYSRANQQGPQAYGFRGNAQNLDLNRDFIKCDSRNAQTFNQIYNGWLPDLFVDNHTSNGADYQYTMTMVTTQHNKLDPHLGKYLQEVLLPRLNKDMTDAGWEMTPYVYARSTPDEGIAGFLDLPRYSSGYAALHNAFSFMSESHMLKPYADRVRGTYSFMDCVIRYLHEQGTELQAVRKQAIENTVQKKEFDLNWKLDMEKADSITFKGYEAKYKPSEVSGLDRLYYDHEAPFEKTIPHFNYYETTNTVEKPQAYVIPQAYQKVIERLSWNGVQLARLEKDISIEVEMY